VDALDERHVVGCCCPFAVSPGDAGAFVWHWLCSVCASRRQLVARIPPSSRCSRGLPSIGPHLEVCLCFSSIVQMRGVEVFVVTVCIAPRFLLEVHETLLPHSSICHAYSKSLRSLAAFLAANHFFSKPFDRSTPSHLQPGRMPYRLGSAAPI
jgi:hypothetical protein